MKSLKICLLFSLLAVFCFSCNRDDGIDGIDGVEGTDGTDWGNGTNGLDGADGTDGFDGQDGADGDSNVITYNYDLSTFSGLTYFARITQITQEVIDNDIILTYVSVPIDDGTFVSVQVPSTKENPFIDFQIQKGMRSLDEVKLDTNNFAIYFFDDDGNDLNIEVGDVGTLKLVIITSGSTVNVAGKSVATGNASFKKQSVLNELKAAGVNVDNYEEVVTYYNL